MIAAPTALLYLVRLPVDMHELARLAHERNRGTIRQRRSDGREVEAGIDDGRILHHLLDETFGPGVLRPFRLMVSPGAANASVYAYTRQSREALLATAHDAAPPESQCAFDLNRLSDRVMPATWAANRRHAFDIRLRPVVRIKSELPDPHRPDQPYKPGAELDAYFVEAHRRHPDGPRSVDRKPLPSSMLAAARTREAVYRDWLAARLVGAAEINPARTTMQRFARTRVARRDHASEGPDITLHGELVVADPAAFNRLLAGGVGRHKAYGFGMLLLRPARRPLQEL